MNTATYTDTVTTILRSNYGALRNAAKILARAIDCKPRTVENWLQGVNAPRGSELIMLMGECDELADEVIRLVMERRKMREAKCPGSK